MKSREDRGQWSAISTEGRLGSYGCKLANSDQMLEVVRKWHRSLRTITGLSAMRTHEDP